MQTGVLRALCQTVASWCRHGKHYGSDRGAGEAGSARFRGGTNIRKAAQTRGQGRNGKRAFRFVTAQEGEEHSRIRWQGRQALATTINCYLGTRHICPHCKAQDLYGSMEV